MKRLFTILLFLVFLFLMREPILRKAGDFLMYENEIDEYYPVAFVLSGGSFERGNHAAAVFNSGQVGKIVCTGENQSPDLKVFFTEKDILESTLTKIQITRMGVPDSLVLLLKKGTSTLEEADYILKYCKENRIHKCMVLSSKFHTKRVKQVFKKKFEKQGIQICISGAPSSAYNEMEWWKSENGLITVNNEYIKQLYYLVKKIRE